MRLRCIIDKDDLPKLIKGEELTLTNDKISAVTIEVNGTLTNGDVVKTMFPKYKFERCKDFGVVQMLLYSDNDDTHLIFITEFNIAWWDSPYKECDKE